MEKVFSHLMSENKLFRSRITAHMQHYINTWEEGLVATHNARRPHGLLRKVDPQSEEGQRRARIQNYMKLKAKTSYEKKPDKGCY